MVVFNALREHGDGPALAAFERMVAEVDALRLLLADRTPAAPDRSAAYWRNANAEASKRLGEARDRVVELEAELEELRQRAGVGNG